MTEADAVLDDPLIGTRLDGRYTIRGVLGQGGMGVVYEGVHDELGRSVAIKVLNPAWASDRIAVERFLREARTASSFSHGNIVDVSDLGRLADGRPYLIMPKISGIDLTALLAQIGPQPAKRVAELLTGVASALDLIHAKGYVHRDIKPENLMYVVREDGSETVMLLDFGIAKLMMSSDSRLTGQGAVFGTPHFMPPEAWNGALPDARADVYALASVAFELVSGVLPFDSDTVMQLMSLKMTTDAPTLAHVTGIEFPPEVEHALACGLARDPEARYETAGEFVNAMREATVHAPVSWRTGGVRAQLQSAEQRVTRRTPLLDEPGLASQRTQPQQPAMSRSGRTDQLGAGLRESERRVRPTQSVSQPPKNKSGYWAVAGLGGALVLAVLLLLSPEQPSTQIKPTPAAPAQSAVAAAAEVLPPPTAAVKPPPASTVAPRPPPAAIQPTAVQPTAAPVVAAAPVSPPTAATAVPPTRNTALPTQAPPRAAPPAEPPAKAAPAAASRSASPRAPSPAALEPDEFELEPTPEPAVSAPVIVLKEDESEPEIPEPPPHPPTPSRDPELASELTQQATAALLRGEIARAVKLLREATTADPTQPLAWRTLGLALERSGEPGNATNAYRHYLELVPKGVQSDMVRERMQALSN